MAYSVKYSKSAEKYLDAQSKSLQKRIIDAVDELPAGDVRKLQGRQGYRLTIGGFRVLFDYIDKSTIDVITIAPRGDVYKKQQKNNPEIDK